MNIDLYILAFSAVTVLVTIWMGFRSAKKSKTASDFFVAGRSVSVGWNASAISGEYLSAASFMGIAGMVMSSGYDALWYPVCYACGYLFLLLFIAGPLRRFGAYTIPDFAEGRFDSPVFRKIAVVFVLFIGFFYTMPQMKGAGTTLAYIFDKVDLRGVFPDFLLAHDKTGAALIGLPYWAGVVLVGAVITLNVALGGMKGITLVQAFQYWAKMFAISVPIFVLMAVYGHYGNQLNAISPAPDSTLGFEVIFHPSQQGEKLFNTHKSTAGFKGVALPGRIESLRARIFPKAGTNRVGTMTAFELEQIYLWCHLDYHRGAGGAELNCYEAKELEDLKVTWAPGGPLTAPETLRSIRATFWQHGILLAHIGKDTLFMVPTNHSERYGIHLVPKSSRQPLPPKAPADATWLNPFGPLTTKAAKNAAAAIGKKAQQEKLSREGREVGEGGNGIVVPSFPSRDSIPLRADLSSDVHMTVNLDSPSVAQALAIYAELTDRQLLPNTNSIAERADDFLGRKLSALKLVARSPAPDSGVRIHADGPFTAAEVKTTIEAHLRTNGLAAVAVGEKAFRLVAAEVTRLTSNEKDQSLLTSAATAEKAWLAKHEKPLALLYTYSLIIAIVCGTAGLPHILVRFYTNPDGTAAKKTTMWVMILIGVFYVFPPVFGVIGRNLLPDLYAGVGAKGTDKIVLELPRILNATYPPLGSILSGITCAGAFAAFMSTFSGLLVSMTGALAHDVYGRILRPKATADERMRMFKIGAVIIGAVAILLGMQVEQLQINFMVGQAFAIAAASYFPLLFMAVWWRKLTMKGAATGMLTGGLLALTGISLTSFSDLKWIDLADFWALHPLARILCEQPAIWAVPLAITLMVIVSKLTAREVPGDIRMKMLVLHAPEQLGLKQEYIQEHQAH